MNFLKHLQKRPVRTSTQSSLIASANVPNSGLTFVDNSQGASAAVAEFSQLLDVAFDRYEYDGDPGDQLRLQLKRLYNEAATHPNSNLKSGNIASESWECSRQEAEIVAASFACAAAVYEPDQTPSVPGLNFHKEASINPSTGGTKKATEIFLVKQSAIEGSNSHPLLPMVVVAIRGTASWVDRMVNLNGDGKELKLEQSSDPLGHNQRIYAHAGFLSAAENRMLLVSSRLNEIVKNTEVKHVLLTGHSAGGAVASLMFTKYLSQAAVDHPSLKFSLISFGAPPVTRPSLDSLILGPYSPFAVNRGLVLSVVNEYDLVSRSDSAYIRSLVDLYRSIYHLPPIQDNPVHHGQTAPELPRLSFEVRTEQNPIEKSKGVVWPMPEPVYWHIGNIVTFMTELIDSDEGDDDDQDEVLLLSTATVQPGAFRNLLWCNLEVHKRLCYKERVDMLLEGRFNGRKKGW